MRWKIQSGLHNASKTNHDQQIFSHKKFLVTQLWMQKWILYPWNRVIHTLSNFLNLGIRCWLISTFFNNYIKMISDTWECFIMQNNANGKISLVVNKWDKQNDKLRKKIRAQLILWAVYHSDWFWWNFISHFCKISCICLRISASFLFWRI